MSNSPGQPFILERIFAASADTLWRALTDKDEMKQWYFDLPEFKAEVGFAFTFTGGPTPERQYVHLCKVTEVVHASKLSYSWRYEGFAGDSLVSFELFPQGQSTLLRLTHHGVDTFPTDNPDFAKQSYTEGWNALINQSLLAHVEK